MSDRDVLTVRVTRADNGQVTAFTGRDVLDLCAVVDAACSPWATGTTERIEDAATVAGAVAAVLDVPRQWVSVTPGDVPLSVFYDDERGRWTHEPSPRAYAFTVMWAGRAYSSPVVNLPGRAESRAAGSWDSFDQLAAWAVWYGTPAAELDGGSLPWNRDSVDCMPPVTVEEFPAGSGTVEALHLSQACDAGECADDERGQ